jgi:hypothetical protein
VAAAWSDGGALALAAVVLVSHSPPRGQQACAHYEPTVVTLEGTLVRRAPSAQPGPAAETAFLLALSPPLCVTPDSASADADRQPESSLREVQLAIGPDAVWAELQAIRGTRLRVTGELFRAAPGRRPPVLLWVIHFSPILVEPPAR